MSSLAMVMRWAICSSVLERLKGSLKVKPKLFCGGKLLQSQHPFFDQHWETPTQAKGSQLDKASWDQ